jgi:hypothetical protein
VGELKKLVRETVGILPLEENSESMYYTTHGVTDRWKCAGYLEFAKYKILSGQS